MDTTDMRAPPEELTRLGLAASAILHDVPLRDLSVVDLPGGGAGRTLADVRALIGAGKLTAAAPARALFALRWFLGRLLGWDAPRHQHPEASYLHRLSDEIKRRSLLPPGSPDGPFRLLYLLDRESLAEIQNATVHAFLATALIETNIGYRLYWAVYVKPVSWLTPVYMTLIEPFRRFVVYPALLRRLRRAWQTRYPATEGTQQNS
jgi:hypothetical protein